MTMVDPMKPVKQRPAPAFKRPVPRTIHTPMPEKIKAENQQPQVKRKRKKRTIPWRAIILGLMCASLLVLPELIGQLIIIAYAVWSLIRRYKPRGTFGLAVLFLLLSPLMDFLTGETNGAVLAGYSFFFLLIGLVQLLLEFRRISRELS